MSQSTVAKRYAEALFQYAQQHNAIAEISTDLKELAKAFAEAPELLALLQAPKISGEKKKAMLSEILSNAHTAVVNTLLVLIDRKRINEVAVVAEEFPALASASQGEAEA